MRLKLRDIDIEIVQELWQEEVAMLCATDFLSSNYFSSGVLACLSTRFLRRPRTTRTGTTGQNRQNSLLLRPSLLP